MNSNWVYGFFTVVILLGTGCDRNAGFSRVLTQNAPTSGGSKDSASLDSDEVRGNPHLAPPGAQRERGMPFQVETPDHRAAEDGFYKSLAPVAKAKSYSGDVMIGEGRIQDLVGNPALFAGQVFFGGPINGANSVSTNSLYRVDSLTGVVQSKSTIGQDFFYGQPAHRKNITVDANGTMYFFNGIQKSNGANNLASLTSLSSQGTPDWTLEIGSPTASAVVWPHSVSLDPDQNIYLTGAFLGELVLPGMESLRVAAMSSCFACKNLFVVKVRPNGTIIWAKSYGGSDSNEDVSDLVAVKNGFYLVGATTSGSMTRLPYAGGVDAFVARMNGDGQVEWSKQFGTPRMEQAGAVTADKAGNAYVVSTIATRPKGAQDYFSGQYDIRVQKFSPTGREVWSLVFGTQDTEWPSGGIAIDPSDNSVYVGGATRAKFYDEGDRLSTSSFVAKITQAEQFAAVEGVKRVTLVGVISRPSGGAWYKRWPTGLEVANGQVFMTGLTQKSQSSDFDISFESFNFQLGSGQ